jgi:hypothetical protein
MTRLLALSVAMAALVGGRLVAASGATPALPGVLTDAIAHYATLASYADKGTVSEEIAGMIHESSVRTYFRRATRDLYFDYHPHRTRYPRLNGHTADTSGNRLVVWMLGGRMESYSFYFKRHTVVGPDQQTSALKDGIPYTAGTSVLIPSLLYPKGRLPGTPLQLETAALAGTDSVDGRRCHKITGEAAEYYPSGRRTNVRQVTLWIDADTKLVRRIVEEKQTGDGTPHRLTVTLDPVANPTIADTSFKFAVP